MNIYPTDAKERIDPMNLNYLFNNTFSQDIAIDLGTDNTLIYIQGKGVVLTEPSYISYDKSSRRIAAVGSEAKEMAGKAPRTIKVIKPIEKGVVADLEMASKMLGSFISRVCEKNLLKPRAVVSVPAESTDVEQRALCDLLKQAGARDVFLVEAPLAAAAGAGCDISLARGMLIADLGGGKSDAASISLGASVIKKSINTSGNTINEEIIKYVKKAHNLNIGEVSAERVKCEIGCAYPFELSKTTAVSGCDVTSGMPRTITLNSEELREVITPSVREFAALITGVLEDTPPALQSDIMEDGILITGGGAMLYGIDKFLRSETGIKIFTTENSDRCVINGVGGELIKLDNPSANRYFFSIYDN